MGKERARGKPPGVGGLRQAKTMARVALFSALLSIFSQIAIPLPMVPISLGLLAVYLAGLLLPLREAVGSVGLFLLMGGLGLPVFAGFRGGPAALFGSTGGFLLGYLLAAALVALMAPRAGTPSRRMLLLLCGLLCCYVPGLVWFMRLTGLPLPQALQYCVWPFLPGDAVKIALAAFAAPRLEGALRTLR